MALRTHYYLSTLLLAAAASASHGAELGEARVLSHIGQQLVADVELTLLEDPGSPVKVRLASPDVYRGANIAMPPVLSSLNMTVMRQGGRQFLHLTSLKPVERRHLHVYLELADGGQRSVRLVTLWLTPDPNPAPPPVRASVPEAPTAQAEPAAHPAAALQAGEEYVGTAPVRRRAAPRPPVAPQAAPQAARARKPVAPPTPASEVHAAAPSCAPQPSTGQLEACLALGEKNAALRHDLVRLEEKVKTLQGAAGKTSATVIAAPAAVHGAAPVPAVKDAPKDSPKGAARIQRKPKKVEPPEPDTPWLLIGGAVAAVAALAGLVLALLRRRKRGGFGKIPAAHKPVKLPKTARAAPPADGAAAPHFMASVKARLMPNWGKTAGSNAAAAGDEPVLTDVISPPK